MRRIKLTFRVEWDDELYEVLPGSRVSNLERLGAYPNNIV